MKAARSIALVTIDCLLGTAVSAAQEASNEWPVKIPGANCSTTIGGSAECNVPARSEFSVIVALDSLRLPDSNQDTIAGYYGFQIRLSNSAELMQVDSEGQSEVIWPDCGFPAERRRATSTTLGCATDIGAKPSVFMGPLVDLRYNCSDAGVSAAITLIHGGGTDSLLVAESLAEFADDDSGGQKTLTIHCLGAAPWPPAPTVEVPPRSTFLADVTVQLDDPTGAAPIVAEDGGSSTTQGGAVTNEATDDESLTSNGDADVASFRVWLLVGLIAASAAAVGLVLLWRAARGSATEP